MLSLIKIGRFFQTLSPRRAVLAAFLAGALSVLALPPISMVPVLWIAFPCLIWLFQGCPSKIQAFRIGWCFGFGLFLFGLYWISFALTVDLETYAWLIPLAVAGFPGLLAILTGLMGVIFYRFSPSGAIQRCLFFAALWSVFEWIRGHIFTGFPWNLIGYSWFDHKAVLQTASVTGIYGLSLLTVLWASIPALLGQENVSRTKALWANAIALLSLLVVFGAGYNRLYQASEATVNGVTLRLVQPNIEQSNKWDLNEWPKIFARHLSLSKNTSEEPVTHIIWPETAVTTFMEEEFGTKWVMAQAAPKNGAIITGFPRRRITDSGQLQFFNSLGVIDDKARLLATYDKVHLVPFGEYLPFRKVLSRFMKKITNGSIDFVPGPGPRTLHVPGLPPFSPLICYEAIFPGKVIDPNNRPAWLLNLTNDGWYGKTAGPYQHFAMAGVRAVEEGIPLVRVASTGISGVVDSYGRVTDSLRLGQAKGLNIKLPVASLKQTWYSRLRDVIYIFLLTMCFVCSFLRVKPKVL